MKPSNKNSKRNIGLLIKVVLIVLLALPFSAQAAYQDFLWVGGSGYWDDPNKWIIINGPGGAGIPRQNDRAYLFEDHGNLQLVKYQSPYTTEVLDRLIITGRAKIGLSILEQEENNDHLKSKYEYVGGYYDQFGMDFHGNGMHIQSNGSNIISNNLYLGYNTDSLGTYRLSNVGVLSASAQYIGFKGVGKFFQTGGYSIDNIEIYLGRHPGSSGTYEMSGGELVTNELFVGYQGEGNFSQTAGTTKVLSKFRVGEQSGGQGTYELWGDSGKTPELSSKEQVVGFYGTGTFKNVAGKNTVAEEVNLGYANSGSGTYYLAFGGKLQCDKLIVGRSGNGVFNNFLGFNSVRKDLYLGYNSDGTGSYSMVAGTLDARNEYIGYAGTGTFNHYSGYNAVSRKLVLAAHTGSTGTYTLHDGILRVGRSVEVRVGGTFTQKGGQFYTRDLLNEGLINFEGGEAKVMRDLTNQSTGTINISQGPYTPTLVSVAGDTTNYGTIKTTGVTVTWGGTFTNNGAYISDPSKQTFYDLSVGPSGYLVGYSQDLFVVQGDLKIQSQMPLMWQTEEATLQFVGDRGNNSHRFWLPGEDQGPKGGRDNFKWGTLILGEFDERGNLVRPQTVRFRDGNPKNQGTALYLGKIAGLDYDPLTLVVANLLGFEGLAIYYDPLLNPDLKGLTYSLTRGGHLMPTSLMPASLAATQVVATPLPASVLLLGSGLLGLGLLGWRRRLKIIP